jgi:hypothetical protein
VSEALLKAELKKKNKNKTSSLCEKNELDLCLIICTEVNSKGLGNPRYKWLSINMK